MTAVPSTVADPAAARAAYRQQTLASLSRILVWGLALSGIALLCATEGAVVAALGIGFLVAAAAFAAGALFGFLFGVPRVLARETGGATGTVPGGAPGSNGALAESPTGGARQRLIASNTNLERISDWLSTMLVGITLTQLGNINGLLVSFADMISQRGRVFGDIGKGPTSAGALPLVCSVLLILGLVCGFMFMYLNTRLILTRLFADTEDDTFEPLPRPVASAVRAAQAITSPTNSIISQRLAQSKILTVGDGISAMYDALYKLPDGYKTTISLAGSLSVTSAVMNADFWLNLACAFGQAHAASLGTADEQSNRDNCLDAVRRTLAINPAYKDRLARLTGPDPVDDDLTSLGNDPELRSLLGL